MDDSILIYECKVHMSDGPSFGIVVDGVGLRLLSAHDKVSSIDVLDFKSFHK